MKEESLDRSGPAGVPRPWSGQALERRIRLIGATSHGVVDDGVRAYALLHETRLGLGISMPPHMNGDPPTAVHRIGLRRIRNH